MLIAGASFALAGVLAAALLWKAPSKTARRSVLAGCTRSTYLAPMYFCGSMIVYKNPDGSLVRMKPANFAPAMHPAAAP